jgi:hypothetical protein
LSVWQERRALSLARARFWFARVLAQDIHDRARHERRARFAEFQPETLS